MQCGRAARVLRRGADGAAAAVQGSARVIRCLQDAREQLSPECGVTLFDQEVMMSESIEFNAPMARACADEVATFCEGVPAGDARVLWCLQQHKDDGQFGKGCRDVRSHAAQGTNASQLQRRQCTLHRCWGPSVRSV